MDDFHRRLAQISFAAGDDLGLVLAGGYAIAQYGLTSRPSQDVDFATASAMPLPQIPIGSLRRVPGGRTRRHSHRVHAAHGQARGA